jgi:polyphosphate kinase
LKAILDAYLNDNVNARELRPDGTYVRVKVPDTGKRRDAQLEFVATQGDFN